jgi:hypothetical protein
VLDGNNEKLSKQTNATALTCNTPGKALQALQAAARHLGLNGSELFSHNLDGPNSKEVNQSAIKQWLETAVEHYRKTRL